jgi:hypothetical protein
MKRMAVADQAGFGLKRLTAVGRLWISKWAISISSQSAVLGLSPERRFYFDKLPDNLLQRSV